MDANYDCMLLGKHDISVLNVGMANKVNSDILNYTVPFLLLYSRRGKLSGAQMSQLALQTLRKRNSKCCTAEAEPTAADIVMINQLEQRAFERPSMRFRSFLCKHELFICSMYIISTPLILYTLPQCTVQVAVMRHFQCFTLNANIQDTLALATVIDCEQTPLYHQPLTACGHLICSFLRKTQNRRRPPTPSPA